MPQESLTGASRRHDRAGSDASGQQANPPSLHLRRKQQLVMGKQSSIKSPPHSDDREPITSRPRLLAIPGSIRAESTNAGILRTLAEAFATRASVTLFGLRQVPLYDADLDTSNPPEAVAALRAAISDSDGLIICSPEYNYGIPGVLKNAIDWASRPAYGSPLKGKPALILTSSAGQFGGARAHAQIRESLSAALCPVISRPQIAVPLVAGKMQQGRLTDLPTLALIARAVEDLIEEIEYLKGLTR